MKKIIRDGKVGVVYSPGFGAGWSTWGDQDIRESVCMDADIVQAVLDGDNKKAVEIATQMFPDFYAGGSDQLCVGWVPEGEQFEITEHDGSESLSIIGQNQYMVA